MNIHSIGSSLELSLGVFKIQNFQNVKGSLRKANNFLSLISVLYGLNSNRVDLGVAQRRAIYWWRSPRYRYAGYTPQYDGFPRNQKRIPTDRLNFGQLNTVVHLVKYINCSRSKVDGVVIVARKPDRSRKNRSSDKLVIFLDAATEPLLVITILLLGIPSNQCRTNDGYVSTSLELNGFLFSK